MPLLSGVLVHGFADGFCADSLFFSHSEKSEVELPTLTPSFFLPVLLAGAVSSSYAAVQTIPRLLKGNSDGLNSRVY